VVWGEIGGRGKVVGERLGGIEEYQKEREREGRVNLRRVDSDR
jgi:hypothetical protein